MLTEATPLDIVIEALESCGSSWRASGSSVMAQCPAHDDNDPSLSVSESDDGKVLLYCQAGCDTGLVLDALGLDWPDLFADSQQYERDGVDGDGEAIVPPSPADVDLLDAVYTKLLENLPLSAAHRLDLMWRGLSSEAIDEAGYRSLDRHAAKEPAERAHRAAFADAELLQVPGFVESRFGVRLVDVTGMLIPVRDVGGRVVALKVRLGDPGDRGKYLYLSSSHSGGPSAKAAVHIPMLTPRSGVVRVTEGELKADVAGHLSGVFTIGMPGVGAWQKAVDALRALDHPIEEVLVALDAEPDKPQVQRACQLLVDALLEERYRVKVEHWNPADGKGIDDLLNNGHSPRTKHMIRRAGSTKRSASARVQRAEKQRPLRPRVKGIEEFLQQPDPTWLVQGMLPDAGCTLLFGSPGAGKSFAALDLALCVAATESFHGRDVEAGPVVYIAAEGAPGLRNRMRAWLSDHRLDLLDGRRLHIVDESIDLLSPASARWLSEVIDKVDPILIVIDTLARCMRGGDENSGKDLSTVLHALEVATTHGVAVLLVHHSQKKDPRTYRGHSSLEGAADTVIAVTQDSDGVITLRCQKQKDAAEFAPLKFTLEPAGDSCVLVPFDQPRSARTEAAEQILAALHDEPEGLFLAPLMKRAGLKRTAFYEAVDPLVEAGTVMRSREGRHSVYRLGSRDRDPAADV